MSRVGGPATVADRLDGVRARIAAAAAHCGREPGEVRLVAVAKWQPLEAVRAARDAGATDIGESYAQELAVKAAAVDGVRWHFVGRLQRNKAGVLVDAGALVHSLDSLAAARALGRRAVAAGSTISALVQVEVEDRPAAHGIPAAELAGFVQACRGIEALELQGLMVLPRAASEPEAARPAFRRAAELARNLGSGMQDLSMGMTADLEVAIEEGATMVRVGTAVFGPRPAPRAAAGSGPAKGGGSATEG